MGLMDLPELVGNAVGSTEEMGGLILSFAVIAMVGLLLTSVTKGKEMNTTSMFVLVVLTGCLTAIGWFPLGLLIIGVIACIALIMMKFLKG